MFSRVLRNVNICFELIPSILTEESQMVPAKFYQNSIYFLKRTKITLDYYLNIVDNTTFFHPITLDL